MRVGDRFESVFGLGVWEFLRERNNLTQFAKCISLGEMCENIQVGDLDFWALDNHNAWAFIGNYAKMDNFNELYDILNGRDDQTNTPGH